MDIVSNVVYPWRTIGYTRLEKAISDINIIDKVDIKWHSFELNPKMPIITNN